MTVKRHPGFLRRIVDACAAPERHAVRYAWTRTEAGQHFAPFAQHAPCVAERTQGLRLKVDWFRQADGCYARKAKVKAVEGRLSRLDLCWLNRLPRPLTRSESVRVPLG